METSWNGLVKVTYETHLLNLNGSLIQSKDLRCDVMLNHCFNIKVVLQEYPQYFYIISFFTIMTTVLQGYYMTRARCPSTVLRCLTECVTAPTVCVPGGTTTTTTCVSKVNISIIR